MLKGSGLIRAYPRLNARIRRRAASASNDVLQPAPTIFNLLWSRAAILCLLFSGAIIGVVFALRITIPEAAADAFTPYQMLYPGLELSDLGSSACSVYTISPYTHEQECEMHVYQPDADAFHKVTLSSANGSIGKVRFECSNIVVGDLVRRWGRPDQITHVATGYLLRWSKQGVTAQARGSQWFNYQLPVETVMLT